MKIYCPCCRMMAALLFIVLFSFNSAFAQPGPDPDTEPPSYDTVIIIKTNWLNTKGCSSEDDMCLQLAPDNKIVFSAKARMALADISNHPTARVQYFVAVHVPGGTSTVTGQISGPINNSTIFPVTLENGASAYEANVGIEVDVSAACLQSSEFEVEIGYRLVETYEVNGQVIGIVGPYPVGDHPDLFPPGLFRIHPSGLAQEYEKRKLICCYDPDKPEGCENGGSNGGAGGEGGGLGEGEGSSRNAELNTSAPLSKADIAVFPNPTYSTVQAQYTMKSTGEMTITCMDAQGRLISQHQQEHSASGQYQLPITTENWVPGVYYLRFETAGATQTLKVVKLNE